MKKRLLGIVGSGMIGRDPFNPYCWSGSSLRFFRALQEHPSGNLLQGAFGVEASRFSRARIAVPHYSPNRRVWQGRFHLDTRYYQALTGEVRRHLETLETGPNVCPIQLGAIYDVPAVVGRGTACFSYHDGNIAMLARSPFFSEALRPLVSEALAWERRVYDGLTKIFTMSEYLRRSFIDDFGQDGRKVVTVGVGPNFDPPRDVSGKSYKGTDVLFIGIDFERKGGEPLLRAFAQAVRSGAGIGTLHIVGPRVRPRILDDRHLTRNVVFHGFLDKRDPEQAARLRGITEGCTLFVLPTRYEPFGIAVLEAMYHGMGCVATGQWAMPEMITPGRNGWLLNDLDDTEELADYLVRFSADEDLRREMGQEARRVAERYTWQNVADAVFEELPDAVP